MQSVPNAFQPLDPATVIAGHRRRRRRQVTAALAAVSVLVAAGVVTTVAGSGRDTLPPVASTPSTSPESVSPAERACRAEISASAKRSARLPDDLAAKMEVVAGSSLPGVAGKVLVLKGPDVWLGCDTVADRGRAVVSQARPLGGGSFQGSDFATAFNVITVSGKLTDYYWAAGILPDGIKRIRYRFEDGSRADAKVVGSYWIMQSLQTSGNGPAEVELIDAGGKVVRRHPVDPTGCPLETRGC
ncbi:hypothetical protein [Kribbella amoyensis]|uniref:hypothetical protein n=1 Tax=Kribbella amoyensis TaxID=996641 RepID=UPI0011A80BF6|nr:hypothetical protein [Kribbella amoyensis]